MAGNNQADIVAAFLSRLLGEDVTPDTPVRLRSVQRAAFLSWVRKEGLVVSDHLLTGSAPVSVLDMLAGRTPSTPPTAAVSPVKASFGVGIDIEDVATLPAADDYRDNAFFQDHFTSAEISYCLLQADVRASLCGTWAAKEALLKAGVSMTPAGRLREIEISRDQLGRPTHKGWYISISHTPGTAVAVCIAQPGPLPPPRAETADATAKAPPPTGAPRSGGPRRMGLSAVGIAAAIILASLVFLLRLVPGG